MLTWATILASGRTKHRAGIGRHIRSTDHRGIAIAYCPANTKIGGSGCAAHWNTNRERNVIFCEPNSQPDCHRDTTHSQCDCKRDYSFHGYRYAAYINSHR